MNAPLEHIRLSKQARDQLITLKRNTGVRHWNVLCRWAFAVSLSEKTTPTPAAATGEQGVEIAWPVFAGEHSDVLLALLLWRQHKDGIAESEGTLALYLRAHIQRGLGYLTSDKRIQDVASLIALSDE